MQVSGQFHVAGVFSPGKEAPLPIEKEADWAPELVWTFFLKIKFSEKPWLIATISTLSVFIRFTV
jgi:hypothetical protein